MIRSARLELVFLKMVVRFETARRGGPLVCDRSTSPQSAKGTILRHGPSIRVFVEFAVIWVGPQSGQDLDRQMGGRLTPRFTAGQRRHSLCARLDG